MVINEIDRETIERLEYSVAKVDLLVLREIYNRYNDRPYKDCLCTSLRCKIFRKVFDEWYQQQK